MTVAGIAVVVLASVVMLSLSRGLQLRLDVSGEAANILMISRRGQNVLFSAIEADELVQVSSMPGLAKGADGAPLISPELMQVSFVKVDNPAGSGYAPVNIRGVGPNAWEVHRSVKLRSGRLPEDAFDLLVGRLAHIKLGVPAAALQPGKTVRFEGHEWTLCGVFEAGGGLSESELWVQASDLMTVLRRQTHSLVVCRFETPALAQEATALFRQTGAIERAFKGWGEKQYYQEYYAESLAWIFWLSLAMVAATAGAGALIGVNTMYTAITDRIDEIATLRVLGFRRRHIAASLLVESVALALVGGLVGAAAGYGVQGVPLRLSQGAFYLTVDGVVLAGAATLTLVIGVVGAILPTIRPLRLSIIEGLRYE
jgi:putative ABC transport system permease protein